MTWGGHRASSPTSTQAISLAKAIVKELGVLPQVQTSHVASSFPGWAVESPGFPKFKEGPMPRVPGSFLLKMKPPQEAANLGE